MPPVVGAPHATPASTEPEPPVPELAPEEPPELPAPELDEPELDAPEPPPPDPELEPELDEPEPPPPDPELEPEWAPDDPLAPPPSSPANPGLLVFEQAGAAQKQAKTAKTHGRALRDCTVMGILLLCDNETWERTWKPARWDPAVGNGCCTDVRGPMDAQGRAARLIEMCRAVR